MARQYNQSGFQEVRVNPEIERLKASTVVDAGESRVLEHRAANRPRSLLAALMVRAGALAPLPQTVKRGRGRPRKGGAA